MTKADLLKLIGDILTKDFLSWSCKYTVMFIGFMLLKSIIGFEFTVLSGLAYLIAEVDR